MVNTKIICKTDAEILLDFVQLKDSGFAFSYAKTEDGISQKYVNCNGRVFGPYDSVNLFSHGITSLDWSAYKGEFELSFKNNGKEFKTEKKKEDGSPGVFTQEEIDLLLTAIAEGEASAPDEKYNEETHVLKLNKKNQEFFITDNKKYGPYYSICYAQYQKEDCFQFIYRKRKKSKNWYYNMNGKETGPFHGSYAHCYFDEQNRAIVDLLPYNFILINGEKVKCFREKYCRCMVSEKNGHTIVIGEDTDGRIHFKYDGILQDYPVKNIHVLDNGDVVYSKIQGKSETWFYNDKQISVPVNGVSSEIYDSLISYKRNDISYFTLKNTEYNGMSIYDIDEGFVFLENHSICFIPWLVPNYRSIADVKDYNRAREGNYIYLYNTNRLAGRD